LSEFRERKLRRKVKVEMGKKIRVTRMTEVELDSEDEGICYNESAHAKKVVKVKAGNKMCIVGEIRRDRSWGDYRGQYCAECPYFIHNKFVGEWEKELLKYLESCGASLRKKG
jgi:hypothetical protein